MSRDYAVPSTEELTDMYRTLSNWGRWGSDDQHGTLNFITPASRQGAAGCVRQGISVSLAHNLTTTPSPENPVPVHHHMLAAGDARDANGIPGYEAARDYFGLDVHGLTTTHVDALSHMFVGGQMFGGRPATDVRSDGARANTVMTMAEEGVVSRGVLLDIPRALGCEYLGAGELVSLADLQAAEAAQGSPVGSGDILLVRWGRGARPATEPGFSGLHAECLPWLHARQVAMLGSDGISDPMPFAGTPNWPFPVHQIGITAMGLPLIDNMALDPLARACAQHGQWDFLFSLAPLRLEKATGCPVNPVAVL